MLPTYTSLQAAIRQLGAEALRQRIERAGQGKSCLATTGSISINKIINHRGFFQQQTSPSKEVVNWAERSWLHAHRAGIWQTRIRVGHKKLLRSMP